MSRARLEGSMMLTLRCWRFSTMGTQYELPAPYRLSAPCKKLSFLVEDLMMEAYDLDVLCIFLCIFPPGVNSFYTVFILSESPMWLRVISQQQRMNWQHATDIKQPANKLPAVHSLLIVSTSPIPTPMQSSVQSASTQKFKQHSQQPQLSIPSADNDPILSQLKMKMPALIRVIAAWFVRVCCKCREKDHLVAVSQASTLTVHGCREGSSAWECHLTTKLATGGGAKGGPLHVVWAGQHALALASDKDGVIRLYNLQTEENLILSLGKHSFLTLLLNRKTASL